MKKIAIAMSLFAAVAGGASLAGAQTRGGTAPGYVMEGYPCQVTINTASDTTRVTLTTSSYCGGSSAGSFTLQRQYGSNISSSLPAIPYDMYPQLVQDLINNSWRRVVVSGTGGFTNPDLVASQVTFKAN